MNSIMTSSNNNINKWEKVLSLSNNLINVASSQKLASSIDTSNFLEDLSKNLLQEVLSTVETPKKPHLLLDSVALTSPFAAASVKTNYSSPFALQTTAPQMPLEQRVTYSYKEPVQKVLPPSKAATPYDKLVNRKRRVRKGKVVHGRKEKICDWCKTTETPEWRTGPQFSTLCNACGLQFRKFNRAEEEQENRNRNAIRNVLNEQHQQY